MAANNKKILLIFTLIIKYCLLHKSVLESIQSQSSKNVLLKELNDTIQSILILTNKTIKFCWVPSHRRIRGNEEADRAAERARRREEPPHYKLPYTDLYPLVERFVLSKWQRRWTMSNIQV